jgi:aminoglycoside 3-N-acetyltransferase
MSVPSVPVSKTEIVAGLHRLGIAHGSLLEVHASLRSVGQVDGGADTVIEALMETVGEQGAIVMPSYPVGPGMAASPQERQRGITWKVRVLSFDDHTTRTGMGVIADRFRDRADVVRQTDSFFSYTAWGKDAALLAHGLEPLVERGGQVLLLGVQMDRCSCLHLAEERVCFPEALQRLLEVPEEIQREYPAHLWGIGYGPESNFLLVQQEAEAQHLITTTMIGSALVRFFNASTMVDLYEAMLQENPYRLFEVDEAMGKQERSSHI